MYQSTSFLRKCNQLGHVRRRDSVLHEFGDGTLHLMDIALLMQVASQSRQLVFHAKGYFLQHQTFTRIVQHRGIQLSHFVKDSVRQTAKAQNVYIEDSSTLMKHRQVLLCLHGELIRYDNQEILLGLFQRTLHDFLIKLPALARAGRSEVET